MRDLLDERFRHPNCLWTSPKDPQVCLEELERSTRESGRFRILVCRGCAEMGYRTCEDIGIRPAVVTHEGDRILWEIAPIPVDEDRPAPPPLRFIFHAPQVHEEIANLRA